MSVISLGMRKHTAKDIESKFWSRVEKTPTCWNWIGSHNQWGYGRYIVGVGERTVAHRFSYALQFGPIPEGSFVCHTCDNRSCVNPAHLFLGSAKDNTADMVSKDRHYRGEKVRIAKLTDKAVRAIRVSTSSNKELAIQYGVHVKTVLKVKSRITWRHLP